MKEKLMTLAGVIALATVTQAASVDWQVTGAAAQTGYSVYLLTSLADSYDSLDALAAASVDSATIAASGRIYSTGKQTAYGPAITSSSSFYYVIVTDTSATSYNYVEATGLGSMVYDPDNQESSPGTFNSINAAAIAAGTSANFVPEPTSGLLMLLGLAGLALKRKRA